MANHGGGNKFVSVNLNKSYGQSIHSHHHSNSYVSNRTRPGNNGSGGMVVLSRPRSSHKIGPKLSVPPPLNLPSLRKEHERYDSFGSGGGTSGGGVSGGGSRPTSSGIGWTKPGTIPLQEKDGVADHVADGNDQGLHSADRVSRGSSFYMPPARLGAVANTVSPQAYHPVGKASVLRGEDFPSLQATLPTPSGPPQKVKDSLNQKHNQMVDEESSNEQKDGSRLSSLVDTRSQLHSSHRNLGNGFNENGGEIHGLGNSRISEQAQKQEEIFPGPLPLVRLSPRSNWADDERDTGNAFTDRGRDPPSSKSEAFWDRDFDMPRISVLPNKPANVYEWRGQRDNGTGKVSSGEVPKLDPYGRDARMTNKEQEVNTWRASSFQKDGFSAQEIGNDKNSISSRPSGLNKENRYIASPFRGTAQNDFGKRDMNYGQGGRQPWNNTDAGNARDRYGSEQSNRYRGDTFQNSSLSKSSFSVGGKGLPLNDPILNFGRDKRQFSRNDKPYLEDPFMKDIGIIGFDERDPFSGGLVGAVRKKKDMLKQTDFHDPVRESFEAELDRVQKMQEQERQRIIEEQERSLELARREEDERMRLAREQEERQRRLEEEVREAAWKAEYDRMEAMRKAEEQRITREKEKERMLMEEERRKQAAKQKLLELEEKMAKRQAEGATGGIDSSAAADVKMSGTLKDKDISRVADVGDWEDGERMVERITASASSDSSSVNRLFDMGSRPRLSRDGPPTYMDRGKPVNPWKRDVFENGNGSSFLLQDHGSSHNSPRRDASAGGGRAFPRKEFYGGAGFTSSNNYNRGGVSDLQTDEFSHLKGQKSNLSGEGDHYNRTMEFDSEFPQNFTENFGDVGWGQGRHRGNSYSSYPERLYQNSDDDGLYSFGRSRYPMRQPRVLPPPSLASLHKSYRGEDERPGPSIMQLNNAVSSEPGLQRRYDNAHREHLEHSQTIDTLQDSGESGEHKPERNTTPRCDSQSSLCVSSPPSSPTHLSHDDLDESGHSPILSATSDCKGISLAGSEPALITAKAGEVIMGTASSSVAAGDDEEWSIENNEQLQEQEEYDEDEDGYEEEDEVHEGDADNIDVTQEFEDMHLGEKGSPYMMDNLVLGFNEGIEVGMPNDDFERSLGNEESTFVKEVSVGSLVERGSFDGMGSDGRSLQPLNGSSQVTIDSAPRMFPETEKALQDLIVQANNAPHNSSVSELLDLVNTKNSPGLSAQDPAPSSVNMASHSSSGQTVMSAVTTGPSQAEVPVKLQFGLFSGSSLIPSPVPAIRIGSIQMPLHMHPQVGPSVPHVHPSQPLFQFGQLRYTSPMSQGVLPMAAQSISFVQPSVQANITLTQNLAGPPPIQPVKDTSSRAFKINDHQSLSLDNQTEFAPRRLNLSQGSVLKEANSFPARGAAQNTTMMQQDRAEISRIHDKSNMSESGCQPEAERHHNTVMKNHRYLSSARECEHQPEPQTGAAFSQSISKEKDFSGYKTQGPGGRGKKYVYAIRNAGPRSSFTDPEASHPDSSGFQRRSRRNIQRTEFRVRENPDKRQSLGLVSSSHFRPDDKSNFNSRRTGNSARCGTRKAVLSNRPLKHTFESEYSGSGPGSLQEISTGSRAEKGAGREASSKSPNIPPLGDGNLKRNARSEDDADAPLQTGIVRIFEQPGIEVPSDEDDFIEVRSKRQMLNDRREQKEKENKAKSRVTKMLRKSRAISQTTVVSANLNKVSAPVGGEAVNSLRSDFGVNEGRGLANADISKRFNTATVPQPLAPIGTPAVRNGQADIRSQTIKSLQSNSLPVVSGGGKNLGSGVMFESKNQVLDNVQTSLGSWGNSRINQQVMALTQTQLDEAMRPAQFDPRASVDHTSSFSEPNMQSSILTKDKSGSSASPVNSLLAGEKIQFGAVTSPTVLPPSSHSVSHGIGPPGPCRPDIQISHGLSAAENDCSLFFGKEKLSNESRSHLEDCEAEAEAAASAIAVAAISTDEIVANGLGVAGDQQLASQSRAEESLSVALPADLSVENPPISLWPSLPNPQNTSNQMLSHFPGGQPHIPYYEMNPMLGAPIFAFGPHDKSASTQSQPQKSNTSGSGPHGNWQQSHSGVDSFYGPPAGFTGPFISPPGVQGPPHMVVYNHFAPVGQFGQVGLSFMGTTYIPSGKQPDWKHNPASSAMGVSEGDMNNLNMASVQRNHPNMPATVQHLAPGSPLLPMPSPMAMFDVSPFQSSPDMSVQARWSHLPMMPLQSVPLSMPLQQQGGVLSSQFSLGPTVEQSSSAANRFSESQTSAPSEGGQHFTVATNATVTHLPDELGLVDHSSSSNTGASSQSVVTKSLSGSVIAAGGATNAVQNGSSGSSGSSSGHNILSASRGQSSQHKNVSGHQYGQPSNYYHRAGMAQKSGQGGEWSHRRMGFHGRNQSLGTEKGFTSSKMKQVYVAKQSTSGTPAL